MKVHCRHGEFCCISKYCIANRVASELYLGRFLAQVSQSSYNYPEVRKTVLLVFFFDVHNLFLDLKSE